MIRRQRNFYAFLWHAFWFSFTFAFTDYNTVLPAMIVKAGGASWHIGVLTFITIGFPLISQLIFTPFLASRSSKKPYLLFGINLRVIALAGIGATIFIFTEGSSSLIIFLIYLWMLLFTFSGAFAGLSYTHIVGISFSGNERKLFLVKKQILGAVGMALSAYIVRLVLSQREYPSNYTLLFFMASAMLLLASLGFWILREPVQRSNTAQISVFQLTKKIPAILKENRNLLNLIIVANFVSASLILIPFLTGSLKERFTLTGSLVGNLLLFQYAGMIISNAFWNRIVRSRGFKGLLFLTILMVSAIPLFGILILAISSKPLLYLLFFFIGGGISAYKIGMEGGLLEISTNENRVLFTGVFGAMNIISSVLPLITGFVFHLLPYHTIFIVFSLITFSSIHFLKKMRCPVDL
ncbi:MAG: MFS transporter [Calditrichaeota bacterium]|nr:MFS transporter [Calditrichota bacterium]